MDTKLTLHFDREVIDKAKKFAASQQMSLSRLTEYLYRQITSGDYRTLSEFPVADWVKQVSEGEATYVRRSRKSMQNEFMASKK